MEGQEPFSYHCQCCWYFFLQAQFPQKAPWHLMCLVCTTMNVRRKCNPRTKSLLFNTKYLGLCFLVTPRGPLRLEAKGHFHLLEMGSCALAGQSPQSAPYSPLHLPSSSKLCKYSMYTDPFRKQEWHLDELPDKLDLDFLCMLRCKKHPSRLKQV